MLGKIMGKAGVRSVWLCHHSTNILRTHIVFLIKP